jgi:hypothetical protein
MSSANGWSSHFGEGGTVVGFELRALHLRHTPSPQVFPVLNGCFRDRVSKEGY